MLGNLVVVVLCACAVRGEWELVWSDEFDGSEIDSTKWGHEFAMGGGGVSNTSSIIQSLTFITQASASICLELGVSNLHRRCCQQLLS